MMRHYGAQRRRGGANPLGVGTVAVGSMFYLQDQAFSHDRYGGRAVCKVPWQVEGFLNGMLHASRRDPDTGQWRSSFWSGRSDMAVVRSLRDGRRRTVLVRLLLLHDDLDLSKGITHYPTLPDLRFYRCRPPAARPALPSRVTRPDPPLCAAASAAVEGERHDAYRLADGGRARLASPDLGSRRLHGDNVLSCGQQGLVCFALHALCVVRLSQAPVHS